MSPVVVDNHNNTLYDSRIVSDGDSLEIMDGQYVHT